MVPYAISATLLSVLTIFLGGWVIPRSSERMLQFTDKYVEHFTTEHARNIQMEVEPGNDYMRGATIYSEGNGITAYFESAHLEVCSSELEIGEILEKKRYKSM